MQLWDTAGGEKYSSFQSSFYRGANACVLVFDLTKADSFEGIKKWRTELLSRPEVIDPKKFPIIVIGNKCDLAGQRIVFLFRFVLFIQVPQTEIDKWCSENGNLPFFEASAKTNEKVKEAFEDITKRALAVAEDPSISAFSGSSGRKKLTAASEPDKKKKCPC